LGSHTITGQGSDGTFRLIVTFDESGATATYGGHLFGSDELEGEWTGANQASYAVTFKRK
jgi:hypothetical protein